MPFFRRLFLLLKIFLKRAYTVYSEKNSRMNFLNQNTFEQKIVFQVVGLQRCNSDQTNDAAVVVVLFQ